ncbi:MAG: hypothetical protein KF910_07985 [Brevundimonas sp.]|uniref:hypothetical protein n=1 Tax=Brevundimonas sp. TaxID=1871086 RepID=UPI0025C554E8|nr:hypothetical protein [Brevundimonas sp.]MBX3477533.1 hypothetical protein [Brevundimonas sp.]
MLGRGLVRKAAAAAVVAACAFVVVVALGAAEFYALCLVLAPLGAAALTALTFAVVALVTALVYLKRQDDEDEEEDEPMGLGERAFALFRQRPILGTAAALAGGFIFLRNPALASMVAAAFTEKPHGRRHR